MKNNVFEWSKRDIEKKSWTNKRPNIPRVSLLWEEQKKINLKNRWKANEASVKRVENAALDRRVL